LYIPDLDRRVETGDTNQRHRFVRKNEKVTLRVKVLDLKNKPRQSVCFLKTRNDTTMMQQENDIYVSEITISSHDATLSFPASPENERLLNINIAIGNLDPIDTPTGQRDRLNNLGYYAGFSQTFNEKQFKWAVEEFQCDHHKSDSLVVDGVCGEKTQRVLKKEYGM
jgi:hypothetical protein